MDIYKQKWTQLQEGIFRVLCAKTGTSLNQRGLARILNVSPTAIAKALSKLEKENYVNIKKDERMNLHLIELNRENSKAVEKKKIINLGNIHESGLVDFLEEKFPGRAIVLFGSYSRGDDTMNSDIDVAIVGSGIKEIDLAEFDKLLEREVFLHFFEGWDKINKELKSNIFNGIVLAGAIEL